MSIKNRFTPDELERIKAAVKQAEAKISGEIVPVFVERSSPYTVAHYIGAILVATLVFVLIILFDRYVPSIALYDPMFILLAVSLGGLVGAIAASTLAPFKRVLLNQAHLDEATRKRAENAFLEEEVFNTRHRTGIMIFISFFEREVIVMADRGISKVVDQKEWDTLVKNIIDNVRKDKVTDGIVAAILRCGEILLEKGFIITPDDINELRDDLRMEN